MDLCNIKSREFDKLMMENPQLVDRSNGEAEGFFVFQTLGVVYQTVRDLRIEIEGSVEDETEKENVANKILRERWIKEAIHNRKVTGVLIPKIEAESRLIKTLASANAANVAAIQSCAEDLQEKHGGNVREYIEMMTGYFRESNERLFEESQNITWEDHGSAESLKKRMKKLAETDPDFEDSFKDLYNEPS